MNVSQHDVDAYNEVRNTGAVNMFDINTVSELSGLSKDQILYIMTHYKELNKEV